MLTSANYDREFKPHFTVSNKSLKFRTGSFKCWRFQFVFIWEKCKCTNPLQYLQHRSPPRPSNYLQHCRIFVFVFFYIFLFSFLVCILLLLIGFRLIFFCDCFCFAKTNAKKYLQEFKVQTYIHMYIYMQPYL